MESTAPTLDLRDPSYRQNPYPTLARIRAGNPIHQDAMGVFYITRHADVTAALAAPTTASARRSRASRARSPSRGCSSDSPRSRSTNKTCAGATS
ncbi:MAG TPA: hypothetical protein VLM85_25535 [Polyangiaceae bacterium]|nr:hypothetical protein [Polyangiaceae bacterium]